MGNLDWTNWEQDLQKSVEQREEFFKAEKPVGSISNDGKWKKVRKGADGWDRIPKGGKTAVKEEPKGEEVKSDKLKLKTDKPDYKVGEDFTIYKVGDTTHLDIRVNNSAGWKTDAHNPDMFKLMDSGKQKASITLNSDYRVSDITDKMHDLTKETMWGEKYNLSKADYEKIFHLYLGVKSGVETKPKVDPKGSSQTEKNAASFIKETPEFSPHYSPTNGDPIGDHAKKFKKMASDLLGEDYISRDFYTNGNSRIKFTAYNKGRDTIEFFNLTESPHSNKIRVDHDVYQYDKKYVGGIAYKQQPIEENTTPYHDRSFPTGDYTAKVGITTGGPGSMTTSEIQSFYVELKKLLNK